LRRLQYLAADSRSACAARRRVDKVDIGRRPCFDGAEPRQDHERYCREAAGTGGHA
ncbi:unnamed protein product, partial [Prorocentrum cordatum]